MSDAFWLSIFTAIPPTIAALGALLAVWRADRRADSKLNHITFLTNSNLVAANKRILELEAAVIQLMQERDELIHEHDTK